MNNLTIKDSEKEYAFIKCADTLYLVNAENIVEIIKLPQLEYPQKLPKFVSGLLDYRGSIINVVDLRSILGFKLSVYDKNTTLLILKNNNLIWALAIDSVEKIEKINLNSIKQNDYSNNSAYWSGTYEDENSTNGSVLNIEKIFDRVSSSINNNEETDELKLLPTADSDVLSKRSLSYKNPKTGISTLVINGENQYITFSVNGVQYCLRSNFIKSFYKLNSDKITKIPSVSDFVLGLLNIKGEYICVIDINTFFGREKIKVTPKSTVIVIDAGEFKLGILSDSIGDTVLIDEDFKNNLEDEVSLVIDKKVYFVLNIPNILNNEKLYVK